jgi:hypothetical protein
MANFKNVKGNKRERLKFWKESKENVRKLLQAVLDDVYEGKGTLIENDTVAVMGDYFSQPNLSMRPKTAFHDIGKISVSPCSYGFYNVFLMTYSGLRYAVWEDIRAENLESTLKEMLSTYD